MEFREFLGVLEKKGMLLRVKKEVDTKFEIATIAKMLNDKPILFENVKGHDMPVVTNICSTRELVAIGLGVKKEEIIRKLVEGIENPKKPRVAEARGYQEMEADLSKLPILTYYPFDGGPYIASGIVIAKDEELGINASYHRAMVIGKDKMVLRILPRHFNEFLDRGNREFAFVIGNPIPVMIASAMSVKLGQSELDIANALSEIKLIELKGHKVPQAEIVMICEMTGEEADEGPFLDLTETPDIVRKQRVAKVKNIFIRENAIFHALLPGGLEHKTLMGMPKEPTIYKEVSKVAEVKDVLITPGGCSWLHGAVSIKKKNPEDAKKAIEAAFKGHKSMKHVFVVDEDIDIHNPHDIEWAMATRFQADKDLVIKEREKGSSLDPSSNLETRETTKVGFDLTIPEGRDPKHFKRPELPVELKIEDYLEE